MSANSIREQTILRQLQLTQLEILNEVVRISRKNNLQYFLVGGTLLGAVRHKGFIPWDDDLDIAMPRKDYEEFLILCDQQLDPKYFLHCNQTDPGYWLPFAKIRKKNTLFDEANIAHLDIPKGIYIDIFPLDNANEQHSLLQIVQARIVKKLNVLILHKRGLAFGSKSQFKKYAKNLISSIVSISLLTRIQQKIMKLNKDDNAPYYVNLGSNYNYLKQTIPKEKYLPSCKIEFEGALYDAPGDWDYVLRRIYDNYMELPPIEKRVTHMPVRIVFDTDAKEVN